MSDNTLPKIILGFALVLFGMVYLNSVSRTVIGRQGEHSHRASSIALRRFLSDLHALPVFSQSGNAGGGSAADPYGGRPKTTPAGDSLPAPGMPGPEDGYKRPKRWDGRRVRNPNGPGYGVPDKDGNVWVPTGVGGSFPGSDGRAHGGPHWDIQNPWTGEHENRRPNKKKR